MNNVTEQKLPPFETDYVEIRESVKIPRDSLRKRLLGGVVGLAQGFQSDIFFNAGAVHVDAKSPLMAFTLLNALKGQTVEVTARGPDSARAVRDLSALFRR
jgi:phosphotransferase system HPr (HPr) family protein